MEIIQKKLSNKHTFTFFDDYFTFAYADKSGSDSADISYAEFPKKSSVQIEQNEWLRNVGLLWMALGGFQLGYAIFTGSSLTGKGFWLLIGVVCIAVAHFTKVKYSVFKPESGNIFIIQNESHDKIIEEITKRKKQQLLKWHGEVNLDNTLENEIEKFRWLANQDVITREEAEMKIAKAELLFKEKRGFSEEKIH